MSEIATIRWTILPDSKYNLMKFKLMEQSSLKIKSEVIYKILYKFKLVMLE